MRRIITGHNEKGKSIVTIDGPPARSIGEDVGGLYELWNTDGNDVISTMQLIELMKILYYLHLVEELSSVIFKLTLSRRST